MSSPLDVLRARSLRSGVKRSFAIPALSAGAIVQYGRDHSDIRGVLADYKEFNSMYVLNNSDVALAIDLDFTAEKRTIIPAHMTMTIDQVQYLEFQVKNLDGSTATTEGQVVITAINERPLAREAR